jgi:hypothetical protein
MLRVPWKLHYLSNLRTSTTTPLAHAGSVVLDLLYSLAVSKGKCRRETRTWKGGDCTVKKTMALALALSFAALLAMVPAADAKGRRGDDVPAPPECQVEDGSVLVCR